MKEKRAKIRKKLKVIREMSVKKPKSHYIKLLPEANQCKSEHRHLSAHFMHHLFLIVYPTRKTLFHQKANYKIRDHPQVDKFSRTIWKQTYPCQIIKQKG